MPERPDVGRFTLGHNKDDLTGEGTTVESVVNNKYSFTPGSFYIGDYNLVLVSGGGDGPIVVIDPEPRIVPGNPAAPPGDYLVALAAPIDPTQIYMIDVHILFQASGLNPDSAESFDVLFASDLGPTNDVADGGVWTIASTPGAEGTQTATDVTVPIGYLAVHGYSGVINSFFPDPGELYVLTFRGLVQAEGRTVWGVILVRSTDDVNYEYTVEYTHMVLTPLVPPVPDLTSMSMPQGPV